MGNGTRIAALALTAGLLSSVAGGSVAPELDGTGWAGEGEYTLAGLRGKAVALYFFEEG